MLHIGVVYTVHDYRQEQTTSILQTELINERGYV